LTAVVYGGGIYRSVDSGLTWTPTSALITNWISVASSADGNQLAALARVFPPPDFYTSSDSGNTWIAKDSPYDRWVAIASSADGSKLVACGASTVLASTNSGSSWTSNAIGNGPNSAVAASADGSRLFFAGDKIYVSTNAGHAWSPIGPLTVSRIAPSADGRKLVAAGYLTPIYVSTNFGATWAASVSPSTNWTAIAASADGSKLVAVVNGGGIWVSQTTSSPSVNITPANGCLALSWIVPSTNFLLQQNADLAATNWIDVPNTPALNLTNLQLELTVLPTNGQGFYRLKTP
jgi:hypothetical protein